MRNATWPSSAPSIRPMIRKITNLMLAICLGFAVSATATAAGPFEAHHRHIEAINENNDLDLEDPVAVFEYVLKSSAPEIHVGPTENYAYFKFYSQGLEWQGNMRLEAGHGAADKVHFAYFVVPAPWHDQELGEYRTFNADDGLTIKQNGRFDYEVSYKGIDRRFLLNDISKINLPEELRGTGELYLGQAHDESGLRFYLLFDTEALDFVYVLDEQDPLRDRLIPFFDADPKIQVGIRTGFVFLKEETPKRTRLVGVYEDNTLRNNYFDGPFDQLPDAWDGEITVRGAFMMIDPDFAQEIDRYGNYIQEDGARVVIAPYLSYWDVRDFDILGECLKHPSDSLEYRTCLSNAFAG
jgi:hypothetical protein